jgi:phosphoglycolate phosphatase
MTPLRLVVFDVDGTLVDSQHVVHRCMSTAFGALGYDAPEKHTVRKTIGLSLTAAMEQIRPDLDPHHHEELAREVEAAFLGRHGDADGDGGGDNPPLFDGVADMLVHLAQDDALLLGVATGKSRRGLDHMLAAYDLEDMFVTLQVADDHPSKPSPSMLHRCLHDTGVEAEHAVIVGDTVFDIEMGLNAGFSTVGVAWGYHDTAQLTGAGAHRIVEDVPSLTALLTGLRD